ncbi:hypothetical protein TNCV_5009401 [Trichonephila clavipes]|nr:hypothetical protein TNCV_5009401 [Trichonephila clavipes]
MIPDIPKSVQQKIMRKTTSGERGALQDRSGGGQDSPGDLRGTSHRRSRQRHLTLLTKTIVLLFDSSVLMKVFCLSIDYLRTHSIDLRVTFLMDSLKNLKY